MTEQQKALANLLMDQLDLDIDTLFDLVDNLKEMAEDDEEIEEMFEDLEQGDTDIVVKTLARALLKAKLDIQQEFDL